MLAGGTNSRVLNPITEDLITAAIIGLFQRQVKWWPVNIVHPAATDAAHMFVPRKIAVETGLLAAKLQFPDRALPAEQFQVPIHGSQADLGQPLADDS